jgi:low temperature requirement protein LtrA
VEVLLLGLVTLIRPRYVVLLVEAIVVIIISSLWRVLSFKHTHLVERMGLLTLIILGEGILGLTKSVAKIVSKTGKVTGGDLGIIVAAVFLVVSTFDVCWNLSKGKY